MPGAVDLFVEAIAQRGLALSGNAAAANALRTAGATLASVGAAASATEEQWLEALADFRGALASLSAAAHPGAPPFQLILDAIVHRLPPVPGLAAALAALPATTPLDRLDHLRDDLQGGAHIGPLHLGLIVPAVSVRSASHPFGDVIGLLPPNGLSIAVDGGPARGHGMLTFSETPHWRLAGAFGINLGVLSVAAFGILERAGGSLSAVLLLGARFTPGIQLGFGFQVSRVGGLIGVNRRADSDAMRHRLASGAVTGALFADDPGANAAAILHTLGEIFVAEPGTHVIGPTLQLTWLKLGAVDFLSLDLGVFLHLPGVRVVVVGRGLAEVGKGAASVLHLQLDVVGDLDPGRSVANLRAALVNARALGAFRLAGDAELALSWGDRPYQVLTLGGFYPGFNPAPAILPPLRRLSLANDFDWVPGISIRFEAYLAATSNTFQIGGRIDVGFSLGVTAQGHLAIDAIFQHRPFHFQADVHGSVRVGLLGRTFTGVDVKGHLSGPGPLILRAELTVDLWLDDFTWGETFSIGRGSRDVAAAVDLLDALRDAIVPTNLRARDAVDPHVIVTPAPAAPDTSLVSPIGTLVFSQPHVPLGIRLERFAGTPLVAPAEADVRAPAGGAVSRGADVLDYFAPGAYRTLSKAQALNQPPYDRLVAGFELHLAAAAATGHPCEVTYQSTTAAGSRSGWPAPRF